MKTHRFVFFAVVVLALVATACGTVPTPGAGAGPTVAPTRSAGEALWPTEAQPLVDLVLANAAAVSGVPQSEIKVLKVEKVDWPDGCLGCGGPAESCIQVITPGYRIVVQAGDKQIEYHTDLNNMIRDCSTTGSSAVSIPTEAQSVVDLAIADLTAKLSITKDQVTVVSVTAQEWRDSSLGCPKPGTAYLDVITPGYQIILEAGGKKYDYRSGRNDVVILCEQSTESTQPTQ